ncbi:carbohydrate-binding module family 13 protein [Macrolepiota fuliginosa MF-IS2]|uniref:Carbohydrate-binding module family 13 protein n=1 Tax=Macrolepiota fuliginosa MF-IS2 TaxID=1400762 RepID=A0A9P5WZQ6_9AGAR|nr:carbohydrate-binding module family 13 protein [Macrolepiota fuliginosa MF-IS2]
MQFSYLSVLAFVASALSQTVLNPNGDSNICLDVKDGHFVNGNTLQVWNCNNTPAQQWDLSWGGSSPIRLGDTGFCLDATSNPSNGTSMQIWECDNLSEQQWVSTLTTSGGIIRLANTNVCLDLNRGDHTPGTVVQAWDCLNGETNQIWTN